MNDLMIWRNPEQGLWAGARAGCFAGTVDQAGTHFYARNQFGEYIGDFTELWRAQKAVEARMAAESPSNRVVLSVGV